MVGGFDGEEEKGGEVMMGMHNDNQGRVSSFHEWGKACFQSILRLDEVMPMRRQ